MRHSENRPEVHAGSMADIAFLLLIFFLVTTTIPNDKGIIRGLPKKCPPNSNCNVDVNERNVLRLAINEFGALSINEEIVAKEDLKDLFVKFIDNNGDSSCSYCEGEQDKLASDNPKKAVLSINTHRKTPYSTFIEVQDEITKAYFELRKKYAKKVFNKHIADLTETELQEVKEAYPFVISEASIKD